MVIIFKREPKPFKEMSLTNGAGTTGQPHTK